MPFSLFLSLLPAIFGFAAAHPSAEGRPLVGPGEVIMRVPGRRSKRLLEIHDVTGHQLGAPLDWEEKKGPKCIYAGNIRGAALSGRDTVDFLLFDRTRLRAELADDCPALDFYNGFYVTPEEGKLCARRDEIHSRIGRSCTIERFRRLVPKHSR